MADRDTKRRQSTRYMLAAAHRRHQPASFRHTAPHHRADGGDDGAQAHRRDLADRPAAPAAFRWRWANTCAATKTRSYSATPSSASTSTIVCSWFGDFDSTMCASGSPPLLLARVENPDVSYRDPSLKTSALEENRYPLIACHRLLAGSLDFESTSAQSCNGGENQGKPSCCSWPCSAAAQTRWPGSGDRARWGAVRLQARPTKNCDRTLG